LKLTVQLFGIAREIAGHSVLTLAAPAGETAAGLLATLRATYPGLTELRSLAVAVNNEYATADVALAEGDEIALIPPVAGG